MHDETNGEVQNTLLLAGGLALMTFGAGMILANPAIRRAALAGLTPLLPQFKDPTQLSVRGLLPDVERYMRIKAM
jgi:hypothetical protein